MSFPFCSAVVVSAAARSRVSSDLMIQLAERALKTHAQHAGYAQTRTAQPAAAREPPAWRGVT